MEGQTIRYCDTSALLNGAPIDENTWVCPYVLRELEKIKNNKNKLEGVRRSAQHALSAIKRNRALTIIPTEDSQGAIGEAYQEFDFLPYGYDSHIIIYAYHLRKRHPNLEFYTSDYGMYVFAELVLQDNVFFWEKPKKFEGTGVHYVSVESKREAHDLIGRSDNPLKMEVREYAIITWPERSSPLVLVWDGSSLEKVGYEPTLDTIVYNGRVSKEQMWPRNPEQKAMFHLLQNREVPIKLFLGKFGSGKSSLALAHALQFLGKGLFNKIYYIRNNIQVKDTKDIGALPGALEDKLLPYVMPIADHVGGTEELIYLINNEKIEVVPMGFLRGRDLKDSIIFVDEAENLTRAHVQLLLGRVSRNSELWICGDLKQTDARVFEDDSGIKALISGLYSHPLFGMVTLMKSERGEVAALADCLD